MNQSIQFRFRLLILLISNQPSVNNHFLNSLSTDCSKSFQHPVEGQKKGQSNPLIVRAIISHLLSGTPKHEQLYSRARLGVPPPVPGDTPK